MHPIGRLWLLLLMAPPAALPASVTRGRVLDAVTGQGIAGVRVMGAPVSRPVLTTTDAGGNFAFTEFLATLVYQREGYLDLPPWELAGPGNGEARTPGSSNGGIQAEVVHLMMPLATLSGVVVDERNRPVEGATVVSAALAGRLRLEKAADRSTRTDAKGEFSLGVLPLESELLVTDPRCGAGLLPGKPPRERVIYARQIHLAPGQAERVHIKMATAPAFAVAGTVENGLPPMAGATLVLNLFPVSADGARRGFCGGTNKTIPQTGGAFSLDGIPAGQYKLHAHLQCGACAMTPQTGRLVTVADGDVAGIALSFSSGLEVSGRIHWEDAAPARRPDVAVDFLDAWGSWARDELKPHERDSFHMTRVQPWDYRLRCAGAGNGEVGPEYYVREVRLNGAPVPMDKIPFRPGMTKANVEVFLARAASSKIRVVDAEHRPVLLYTAALLQHAAGGWKASPLEGVAPGEYIAVALTPAVPKFAFTPELLARYASRGTAVTLAAGETRELELVAVEAHPFAGKP